MLRKWYESERRKCGSSTVWASQKGENRLELGNWFLHKKIQLCFIQKSTCYFYLSKTEGIIIIRRSDIQFVFSAFLRKIVYKVMAPLLLPTTKGDMLHWLNHRHKTSLRRYCMLQLLVLLSYFQLHTNSKIHLMKICYSLGHVMQNWRHTRTRKVMHKW